MIDDAGMHAAIHACTARLFALSALTLFSPRFLFRFSSFRRGQSYNADWSAGFRGVILSLSLSTPETCALSLSLHVAELQLVLLPMAQIQLLAVLTSGVVQLLAVLTSGTVQLACNHRAYLIFRDTRALKDDSPFRCAQRLSVSG
eukprot:407533-Rhodomonas_salina.1